MALIDNCKGITAFFNIHVVVPYYIYYLSECLHIKPKKGKEINKSGK